jgi:WD40 repeat protein/tetratricopeptide (TPR) repeat protein
MTICPTADDLRALLEDRLTADSEPGLLAHIDGCSHCQRALETLTAGDLPSAVKLAHLSRTDVPKAARALSGPVDRSERIGPYRVTRELGRGGMGVVYLATHAHLRREAAVKLIRAGVAARPDEVVRFRREAETVAAVSHPNVVAVYEIGEQDGVPWLALEYVPGGSLREQLNGRPQPPRAAAGIAHGLARGAAAVHAAGVIHRDIKPANVLLATADGTPVPKLTDFGLAKDLIGAGVTQTGALVGTPHYMAPEQTRIGADVGPAADVYGIGAVLYEALTGSPPFNGSDPVAIIHLVATREPVPVRRLQPAVPRDLQTICHKCLEKDPARRYASAAALADDLGRFLAGRPILARPVGPVSVGWRLARRNPTLSVLAVALVAALAAGSGGVLWKWQEATAERDRVARAEQDTAAERDAAVAARSAARRQTALALLDKGIAAAEAGLVGEGLVWMAEALAAVPAADTDLDRVVRTNLAGWLPHAPRARSATPLTTREQPAALTPDGRSLVVWGAWSRRGSLHSRPIEPGAGSAAASELCPNNGVAVSGDGRFVLTTTTGLPGAPAGLSVWDTLARHFVGETYWPDGEWTGAMPAPVGTTTAVVLERGRLLLLDLATGRPVVGPLDQPHADQVTALAFTPDGKTLFTWTDGPTGPACCAWDAFTGVRSDARFGGNVVRQAVFSPRGDRLVTVAEDGTARLWDAAGTPIGSALPSAGQVSQLTFSPDGRYAVLLGKNAPARWWDTARGELVACPTVGPVDWLTFGSDGATLVTTGHAGEHVAWVWELPRAPARPVRLPGPRVDGLRTPGTVQTATDPAWTVALTSSHHNPPRAWDVVADRPGPVPLRLLGRRVSAPAVSPDGSRLAVGTLDRFFFLSEVDVWDAATGRLTARIPHRNWVNGMGFTPDGRVLITGGFEGSINTWDATTGQRLGRVHSLGGLWATGFALAPDGRSVAFGRSPGRESVGPALFDISAERTAPTVREVWADREGTPADRIQFTPGGDYVISYCGDPMSELCRREARTGRPAGPARRVYRVRAVAADADGKTALVASGDGTARLWDLATGTPVGSSLAHGSAVNACALNLARGLALCGCDDGSARLWDLGTGRALGPPLTHGPPLTAVAFSPDGRFVRSVAADGTVRSWMIPVPAPGDPALIQQAVTRRTALALDPGRRVVPLTAAAWSAVPACAVPEDTLELPAWHAARARDAEADGAWTIAAHHLDRLLTTEAPANRAELLARRARCASAAGRFAEAAGWYQRAAVTGSAEWLAGWYAHRAVESAAGEQWKVAAWYLDRLTVVRPNDDDVLFARIEVRDQLTDVDGWASDVTRLAAGATPADRYWWASRAAAKGRWELAAELLEQRDQLMPPLSRSYLTAVARLKAGDTARYARICKEVETAIRDDWPAERLNSAVWLLSLSPGGAAEPDRLARLLARAAETAESNARRVYANTLGAVLIRAGQYEEAVRWIERGVATDGKVLPEDAALLAIAYRRLGDNTRADERLARARLSVDRDRLPAHQWGDHAARELLIAEAAALGLPAERAPLPRTRTPGPSAP